MKLIFVESWTDQRVLHAHMTTLSATTLIRRQGWHTTERCFQACLSVCLSVCACICTHELGIEIRCADQHPRVFVGVCKHHLAGEREEWGGHGV